MIKFIYESGPDWHVKRLEMEVHSEASLHEVREAFDDFLRGVGFRWHEEEDEGVSHD